MVKFSKLSNLIFFFQFSKFLNFENLLIFLIEEFRIFDHFSKLVNYSNFWNWGAVEISNEQNNLERLIFSNLKIANFKNYEVQSLNFFINKIIFF